jgi:ascorbate-specific PTS system EIIC-type component UlaA
MGIDAAAGAAALAVMIAQPYSSQLPSALLILPLQAAVSAWIVEHILLSIPTNLYNLQQTRPTRMRMLYITGFVLITGTAFHCDFAHLEFCRRARSNTCLISSSRLISIHRTDF